MWKASPAKLNVPSRLQGGIFALEMAGIPFAQRAFPTAPLYFKAAPLVQSVAPPSHSSTAVSSITAPVKEEEPS